MNILGFIQSSYQLLIPVVVLLGLLIFVHELGHFLVAKYYKVRVEVFSLGFGPKLLKYKHGDTVYALSAIPLGGYVKMFGDDPTAEVESKDRQHSFLHKPVSQRIAVVLAGPLMNLFFAYIVFVLMSGVGEPSVVAKIGDVAINSDAHKAGFLGGDLITSVNGKPIRYWDEVSAIIESHANQKLSIGVQRENGGSEEFEVYPTLAPSKNILSWKKMAGQIDGLGLGSRSATVAVIENSPAQQAGFETGDLITKIQGEPVLGLRNLEPMLRKHLGSETISFEVRRGLFAAQSFEKEAEEDSSVASLTIKTPKLAPDQNLLVSFGFGESQLFIGYVQKNSPAEKAGLKPGDQLVSINGGKLKSFEDVVSIIQSNKGAEKIGFEIQRHAEKISLEIVPDLKERMVLGKEEKRFEVGIRPIIADSPPTVEPRKTEGWAGTLMRGAYHTFNWTSITVLGIVRLFDGSVSSKNVGGLLSIGDMAKKSWQAGLEEFLRMMGIISINLFILNLLPVPVLDGGHLVFYSIEAIRGSPLSLRKQEALQQLGVIVLFGLMIFALYNDVTRIFFSS